MKRTDYWWIVLAGVVCLGAFLLVEYAVNGFIFSGFPLDDSWIHAQFAHNVAQGNGFTYTGNEQTPGDTSPLWVLIIAVVFKIFGEPNAIVEIRVLSMLAYLCTGIVTAAATYKTTGSRIYGILAGVIVVCMSDVIWAGDSGMETSLCSALLVGGYMSYMCDKRRLSMRTGALFGAATLARPEAIFMFAFAFVDAVLNAGAVGKVAPWWQKAFRRACDQWCAMLVFISIAALFIAMCFISTGHIFPNTYYCKGGGLHFRYIAYFYYVFFSANPVLSLLAGIGMYWMVRNGERFQNRFILYFFLFFPLLGMCGSTTILLRRYFIMFLPLALPPAMVGIDVFVRRARELFRGTRVQAVFASAVVGYSIMTSAVGVYPPHYIFPFHYMDGIVIGEADYFAWNVHNINEQQVRVARWVDANIVPNALVAVNDVGAMGYLSHHPLLDVCGLVSNQITNIYQQNISLEAAKAHVLQYLQSTVKPDYVIIYCQWFPDWKRQLPIAASFVVVPQNNLVCGSDTMSILKMDWSREPTSEGQTAGSAEEHFAMKKAGI